MIRSAVCLTLVVAALAVVDGQQRSANEVIVPLSDPARPSALIVPTVQQGSITVRGSMTTGQMVVRARERGQETRNQRGRAGGRPPAASGLLRLAGPPALAIEEERNRVTLVVQTTDRAIDLDIQVPSHTDLKLGVASSGDIIVDGVEGEIEINNATDGITLTNIGGSVIANAVTGRVKATVTSVSTRPMAFTSTTGDVDVTFPASLKANLKLRSDLGQMSTDFDLTPLPPPVQEPRRAGGRLRIETNRFTYGAINGGGPEIELRSFNGNVYVRRGK